MPNLNAAFNRFPYIEFRYHFEPKNSSTGIHEHAAISLGSGFGSGRDCPSSAYLSLSRNRAMKYMSLVWKGPFWVSLNAERATNSVSIPVSSLHSRTAAERMLSRGSTKPPVDKASTPARTSFGRHFLLTLSLPDIATVMCRTWQLPEVFQLRCGPLFLPDCKNFVVLIDNHSTDPNLMVGKVRQTRWSRLIKPHVHHAVGATAMVELKVQFLQ